MKLYFYHKHVDMSYKQTTIPKIIYGSKYEPPTNTPWYNDLMDFKNVLENKSFSKIIHSRYNFSAMDFLIFDNIKIFNNLNIIIKPADKNLGLVIMDPKQYNDMCMEHLKDTTTYTLIPDYNRRLIAIWKQLESILSKHSIQNNDKLFKSLTQLKDNRALRIAPFYCLPKLHKSLDNPPGRPIVSAPATITYYASVYLDNLFKPVLKKFHTLCFSSRDIIRDICSLNSKNIFNENCVILCADIASLYPSIPIDFGLECVKELFIKYNYFHLTGEQFGLAFDLLSFILKNNYLIFNNNTYKQIKGTAMGTPVAVAYSNLVLLEMESRINIHHIFYKRYIDDLFRICPNSDSARNFITSFNAINSNIQLDQISIDRKGVFLDLNIYLDNNNILQTNIFQKMTSKFQYIPPFSNHAKSIFANWVYNELCRYRLYCSIDDDFNKIRIQFLTRLIDRGYTYKFFILVAMRIPTRETLMNKLLTLNPKNSATDPRINIFINRIPDLNPKLNWKYLIKESAFTWLDPINYNENMDIGDFPSTYKKEYLLHYIMKSTIIGKKNPKALRHYLTNSSNFNFQ